VRLTENLRMFDVVEGGGGDLPVHVLQANGFQSALTQVNAPNAGSRCRHGLSPSSVSREIRRRPKGQVMGPEGWDSPVLHALIETNTAARRLSTVRRGKVARKIGLRRSGTIDGRPAECRRGFAGRRLLNVAQINFHAESMRPVQPANFVPLY